MSLNIFATYSKVTQTAILLYGNDIYINMWRAGQTVYLNVVTVYIHTYIHIYIERERETELVNS